MALRFVLVVAALGFASAAPASDAPVDAPVWGDWIPRTGAWVDRLNYRLEQVRRIEASQERWDAVMNLAVTGLLVPNFTDTGFKVVATPPAVHRRLNETLRAAREKGDHKAEHKVDQISGPRADFVSLGRLNNEIMRDMLPMHEAWAGVPLRASNAYGLRLYKDTNTLTMHTDRVETHVVSSIVHVDRDVDEPWPLVIEGFDGTSVSVDLLPGQTLFYESAKCIHGRPTPMKGRYYTSVFLHYRPTDWATRMDDARRLVEPVFEARDFAIAGKSPDFADLRLTGTGYYEPECAHRWCGLQPGVLTVDTDEDGGDIAGDSPASSEL